jgi:hypothetical protein
MYCPEISLSRKYGSESDSGAPSHVEKNPSFLMGGVGVRMRREEKKTNTILIESRSSARRTDG